MFKTNLNAKFSSYLTSDYQESTKIAMSDPPDLDEVSFMEHLIDSQDVSLLNLDGTRIQVLEEDQDNAVVLRSGIPLRKVTYNDVKDTIFSGIDGSVALIPRVGVSVVVTRASVGYEGIGMPESILFDFEEQFVISDLGVVKPGLKVEKSYKAPIRSLNREIGYQKSLGGASSNFMAHIECKTAIDYFNKDNTGDYILYDGGLYRREPLLDDYKQRVAENSKYGVPVAINKRVFDRSWTKYVSRFHPEMNNSHYDTDTHFLLNVLDAGERTPMIHMARKDETSIPEELQRIASFIRLNSGKIIRVETTYENRYQFEDILSTIYYLSSRAAGELPEVLNRAHTTCKISEGQKELIASDFDNELKRVGIPAYDPYKWSY